MKNLIIILLVICLSVMAGCDDEELIEISSNSKDTVVVQNADFDNSVESSKLGGEARLSDNVKTSENTDKEAGSLENSRPLVVYVCGEVKNEGVYTLEDGSRIIDAIMEAGGYTVDASETYLNLAAGLSDSQMIYVPSKEEVKSGTISDAPQMMSGTVGGTEISTAGVPADGSGSGNGMVNINSATKEQLMTLPGIGESKADKIIAYRESNGGFSSTEEIMQISGIKDGLYNKVKDKICVR